MVVLIGWFGVAAPAEELLFRGIIQGRLRETFSPFSGILLAAVCFALMHVPVAALSAGMTPASSFVETLVSGAIFGLAYECTGNLLVPSIAHAGLWTAGLLVL
ncbi:CPBP family intramembrane glutamic endopeptidase [Halalkalicoccus subterraneus]|uniref:CPBP family intramembrane glutamic endopeptidase n=1 Tax=Halalkalicoccus subterraneus TaxID=2675002 RepID=UPI0013CE7264